MGSYRNYSILSVDYVLEGTGVSLDATMESNVFDRYGWSVASRGAYVYNSPQRFTLYLATDL